ncbi:MAG TPA: hypothetical protein VJU61_03410 [Polyangiaceae bacterium]|nr:hypothetical protein [Polyangiaceae bacterium]
MLAAANACGNGTDSVAPADETPDAPAPPPAEPSEDPLFLIQTRTFSPDGTTGILIPVSSLDEPVDYSRALEQPSGGVLYAEAGLDWFLVGDGEEPVITRYELDAEGRFVSGNSLSFANEGVIYLYAGSVLFVNEHKAYYIDLDQLQAISFDPTDMAITGIVSLAGAAREGFFTSFGSAVIRSDGIYFPGEWYTEPEWDRVPSGSMLIHIDPETDVVTMASDPRCTSMLAALTTSAGTSYWFSDMFNTFARRGYGPDRGVPDCALRLNPGETTFDPDWELNTEARTGGPSFAVLQGGDSTMWFRVFDETAVELPVPADYETMDTAPAWQWYSLDVESDQPGQRNDERPLSSVGALGMYVDGRGFTTNEDSEYSETTLLELTGTGFVERTTVRGVIDDVVRLR